MGCSPELNWRVVNNHELQFKATFPDRPVQMAREVRLNNASHVLTLQAAKVDDLMFAVGAISVNNESVTEQHQLKQALYSSMSSNLTNHRVQVQDTVYVGNQAMYVDVQGGLPNQVAGRLMGYFFIKNDTVYEVFVLGPASLFNEQVTQQWFKGFDLNSSEYSQEG